MKVNRIGIVSIATNKYLEFYFDFITSFQNNSTKFSEVTFYLFTNRTNDAKKFATNNAFSNIVIIEIPDLGWPDATLLRYKIFAENKDVFTTDILGYVDADMLILRDPLSQFELANEFMTFVRHPGYYFEFSPKFFKYLMLNPKKVLAFAFSLFSKGGIGSWDTQKFSTAYVQRRKRRHYFCGGVWFSRKPAFVDFCTLLAERTELGLKMNFIPIWHDESYLNWFAVEQMHNELSPLFCSDGIIDRFFSEKPFLLAVNKPTVGFHGN